MLRSEEMCLILLFINRDTARHIITQIGSSQILHFIDLNKSIKHESLPFTHSLKNLEKVRARIKYLQDNVCTMENTQTFNTFTNKSFVNVEQEVNKHYSRYIDLKEMCKDALQSTKNVQEAVTVLEELEDFLCVDMCPTSFKDCLKNLTFVCFTISRDRAIMLERVLKQVLRGNVVFKKCERDEMNVYLVFTHGKVALAKIRNVVVSLQGRCLDDVTVERGCLDARTRLVQINKMLNNSMKAIDEEEMEIRKMIGVWKYVVEREIKVLKAMNKMRTSHNMMVGQGWITRRSVNKFRKICDMLTKKMGCISFQIIQTYAENDKLYELHEDSDDELEEGNGDHNLENTLENELSNEKSDALSKYTLNTIEITNISSLDSRVKLDDESNVEALSEISGSSSRPNNEENENLNIDNTQSDTKIKKSLKKESVNLMNEVDFKLLEPTRPPTHFITNKVTEAFQNLNNVYGIPRYKEINPALFQAAIYPFFFGVMFGDVFHGLIVLGIAFYMIKHEKTMKVSEMFELVFAGRYAIVLCGLWSIFFGFIYSDFSGLTIQIWPSQYKIENNEYVRKTNYTYPFGIDPVWEASTPNGGLFRNSYKMKIAVIMGFFHMLLGNFVSIFNAIFAKDFHTLYLVIIPHSLILSAMIGYLVFLIFQKWMFSHNESLITVFIDMFQSPTKLKVEVYKSQGTVQLILLSCILCLFPFTFISKPIYMMRAKKKNIWMHHIIEGVEFCIGLISNTASYLRLWAVSLAHVELTSVLNTYLLFVPFYMYILTIPLYIVMTFLMLIGLEGMSATLHALRLNWIEFGAQFYKGDGYLFRPLRFDVEDDEEEEDDN